MGSKMEIINAEIIWAIEKELGILWAKWEVQIWCSFGS
jgi:hypothetical protein